MSRLPAEPEMDTGLPTIKVGGISTANTTRRALAERMAADVHLARTGVLAVPRVVIASNGSVISSYHRDKQFRALIDAADIVDPDGMPLVLATRLLMRDPLRERIATTDFIENACATAVERGIRFFFLGARPGVAATAADRLRMAYPGLKIVGVRHGYFQEEDLPAILRQVRASQADVLWLGLGSPLQEEFAIRYREELDGLAWIRTCGGLFDHIGADVPRAPRWMQAVGLEWLFRAVLEPQRLGLRYLITNPVAAYHLLTKTR
jgi:exopolysaccharide biosynthesis WecB/TagA/CpsF family protein